MQSRWMCAAVLASAVVFAAESAPLSAQSAPPGAPAEKQQSVLGPGLYVFQTRTREATCGDSEPDGYVISYFAAIHGIPHSISMKMELTNTQYFRDWVLTVASNNQIHGESHIGQAADGPESHFDVKLEGDRFKGTGARTYNATVNGKKVRCRVNYDALVRKLDYAM